MLYISGCFVAVTHLKSIQQTQHANDLSTVHHISLQASRVHTLADIRDRPDPRRAQAESLDSAWRYLLPRLFVAFRPCIPILFKFSSFIHLSELHTTASQHNQSVLISTSTNLLYPRQQRMESASALRALEESSEEQSEPLDEVRWEQMSGGGFLEILIIVFISLREFIVNAHTTPKSVPLFQSISVPTVCTNTL